jgi:hypothetical protein
MRLAGFQFGVIGVAFFVAAGLFFKIFVQSGGQINAGLVGEAGQHKKHVGHFIGQVLVRGEGHFGAFEGLFSVQAGHQAGHLPYFFHEDGGIGEFAVVTDADGFHPFVHHLLVLADRDVRMLLHGGRNSKVWGMFICAEAVFQADNLMFQKKSRILEKSKIRDEV